MIYPSFLKENDCIGVPAPSDGSIDNLKKNKYKKAKEYFSSLGYKVKLSKNIFKSIRGRSALAKDRAHELNKMIKDKNIDVLICAAGGEFLVEILPYVDFELFRENPKLIAGFSDPTGILYPLTTKYDIATIYGNNFAAFGEIPFNKSHQDFLNIITGNLIKEENYPFYEEERYEKITGLEGSNLTEKVYWNILKGKKVDIKGRIIGGCFDIISELAGTRYDGIDRFLEKYKEDGIIWYFDNCELSMEETIRTLWKFKELGYFKYTNGIIFGRFGVCNSYFDYDVDSMLKDSVLSDLDIPIIYDADISHKAPCLTIINGSIAHVICEDGCGSIEFELK